MRPGRKTPTKVETALQSAIDAADTTDAAALYEAMKDRGLFLSLKPGQARRRARTVACASCGEEFTTPHPTQKLCGQAACKAEYHRRYWQDWKHDSLPRLSDL